MKIHSVVTLRAKHQDSHHNLLLPHLGCIHLLLLLFLAGLAYLQYHQIANINWNKLQTVSEGAITTLSNAIIQIQSSGDSSHTAATASSLAMTNFGIPLTGSMSAGFTIGFIKG